MDDISYQLGQLDASVKAHAGQLKTLADGQTAISSKLDTLLARGEQRKATLKAGVTGITIVAAIIEGAHQLADFFHRGH